MISFTGTVQQFLEFADLLRAGRNALKNEVSPEILDLVNQGKMVEAVKLRRAHVNCTLAEAHAYVKRVRNTP